MKTTFTTNYNNRVFTANQIKIQKSFKNGKPVFDTYRSIEPFKEPPPETPNVDFFKSLGVNWEYHVEEYSKTN